MIVCWHGLTNKEIEMKRYKIKIIYPSGTISYMIHRDRSEWTKRTALKHLNEFILWHGLKAELEEV